MIGDYCAALPGLTFMLCRVSRLLALVIPVLIALGVVYLVWGIVQYFIGDNEEAKTKGKERIIFGIIGLVVIVGLWGLVYLVVGTFQGPYGRLNDNFAPIDLGNKLLPR